MNTFFNFLYNLTLTQAIFWLTLGNIITFALSVVGGEWLIKLYAHNRITYVLLHNFCSSTLL